MTVESTGFKASDVLAGNLQEHDGTTRRYTTGASSNPSHAHVNPPGEAWAAAPSFH